MRESAVERYLVKEVTAIGGMCQKFTSPGRRRVTDRIVLMPVARIYFVEVKRPGEKPNDGQLREHNRLRTLGFAVFVLDSKEWVDNFVRMIKSPYR